MQPVVLNINSECVVSLRSAQPTVLRPKENQTSYSTTGNITLTPSIKSHVALINVFTALLFLA
jgi:hypothetical protein